MIDGGASFYKEKKNETVSRLFSLGYRPSAAVSSGHLTPNLVDTIEHHLHLVPYHTLSRVIIIQGIKLNENKALLSAT